jgi:hypothetical protein
MNASMIDPDKHINRSYEIRLLASNGKVRLFATTVATDAEAIEFARGLLVLHLDCDRAEVWSGMRLVRQL